MLERLRMDVDECLAMHHNLMETVFQNPRRIPLTYTGKLRALPLRSEIRNVISSRGLPDAAPLEDDAAGGPRRRFVPRPRRTRA